MSKMLGADVQPRARIVVHPALGEEGKFQFDLIDLDGPRRGQRLTDIEVGGSGGVLGDQSRPDPLHESSVRFQLRRYAERNGYRVID